MSHLNYLVITPFFPNEEKYQGGYIYDQVKLIKESNKYNNVIVLKPTRLNNKIKKYIFEGITVYCFPFIQMPSMILNGALNKINTILFYNYLKNNNIDISSISVVHSHTASMACFSVFLKKRNHNIITLLQHHDLDPLGINVGKFSNKKWNITYRAKKSLKLYSEIDCHVCISEACEENLKLFPTVREHELYMPYIKKLNIIHNLGHPHIKNTYILYNGVNLNNFYKYSYNNRTKFTIGCIGNFTDVKNQITLIKAVELLYNEGNDDIILILIGSGPLKKECEDYVVKHGLKEVICFENERPHDLLCEFYNRIDLFCLPSYFEGFGCVFTEAYACGVPFMTCRYQGTECLLDEDTKQKFMIKKPLDYNNLAKLILNYKKNKYAFNLTKEYDINKLICSFLSYIDRIN